VVLLANFLIVPALTYGSQLAIGALGVTVVYSVLRFSNFAHGETMAFGTMITILCTWGLQSMDVTLHPLPTALIAMPIGVLATVLLLLLLDKTVYRYHRQHKASPVTLLIVSIGLMFFIGGLVRFVIGPGDQIFFDGVRFVISAKDFKRDTGLSEGLALKTTQVITIFFAFFVVLITRWFFKKTRTGKSMRAFSDNENLALLSGINPIRVVIITWIIVGTLATIAGTLYGLDKSFKPFSYMQLLLPIFASAIVGGVGNPLGAIAGGYTIAFSEMVVTFAYKKVVTYLGLFEPESLVQFLGTDYKIAVSFSLLVVVLIVKPTGIFNGKTL
jgi:branched-chain amino acid transport system permease protein